MRQFVPLQNAPLQFQLFVSMYWAPLPLYIHQPASSAQLHQKRQVRLDWSVMTVSVTHVTINKKFQPKLFIEITPPEQHNPPNPLSLILLTPVQTNLFEMKSVVFN